MSNFLKYNFNINMSNFNIKCQTFLNIIIINIK